MKRVLQRLRVCVRVRVRVRVQLLCVDTQSGLGEAHASFDRIGRRDSTSAEGLGFREAHRAFDRVGRRDSILPKLDLAIEPPGQRRYIVDAL